MTEYDRHTHQGVISIVSSSLGIWAAETHTRINRSVRTAGRLPSTFHAHELLAIAFNSGVRAITAPQEARLCEIASVKKLSIVIACSHPTFLREVEAYLSNPASRYLNLKNSRVREHMAVLGDRYDFTFRTAPKDRSLLLLKDWADKHVLGGKQFEDYPIDRPSVISVTENNSWTHRRPRSKATQPLVSALGY